VKQQHGEQKEVNQALDLLPHCAVEGCVFAHKVAAEDEGKIREEELSVIHM
jgi:hypothetical protein